MGTTLATFSAFRFVQLYSNRTRTCIDWFTSLLKHAIALRKPVLMINLGPSRADGIDEVEKLEVASGSIMTDAVRNLLCVPITL
jgi:NAD+-dependent protein deacetylase sirtuin 4